MKEVKIIGLELKADLGIIKAHKLTFDENNKLIIFKGKVGSGKTTEQKILQLGTLGSKTLVDNNLYGDIDAEIKLLDGEKNLFVGCKSKDGNIKYTLYMKDNDGNVINNPVIDGVKATPAKYLELLQTKLTWKIDELTSENLTTQRNILMQLYQNKLEEIGVVFDKKNSKYQNSILATIEKAEQNRDFADMIRKQKGGIADDLKNQGYDVTRPETIPDHADIYQLQQELLMKNNQIAVLDSEFQRHKDNILYDILQKSSEITNKILQYNADLKSKHIAEIAEYEKISKNNIEIKKVLNDIHLNLQKLVEIGAISKDKFIEIFDNLSPDIKYQKENAVFEPNYISTKNENGKVIIDDIDIEKPFIADLMELRKTYLTISKNQVDNNKKIKLQQEIEEIHSKIGKYQKINSIVEAVDSFWNWKKCNDEVQELKNKYRRLLLEINTGVEGLKIAEENGDIFLTYNGEYDPEYFNNVKKEARKLSSYSGTQKPIIALLIQNYLLSLMPKALRYLYLDNIPIDKATREVIENMCNDLNITIIMNITGDFEVESLQNGEYLIENGEIFF